MTPEVEDLQAKASALTKEMERCRRGADQCFAARSKLEGRRYDHLPSREAAAHKGADDAGIERLSAEARKHDALLKTAAAEHRDIAARLREAKRIATLVTESERYSAGMIEAKSAERTLADLETRRELQRHALDDLIRARQPIAYAAKTGDAKSQKELDRLAGEQRQVEVGLSDLEHAIGVARQKLAEAKDSVGAIESDLAFEKARGLVEDILAGDAEADAALAQAGAWWRERDRKLTELSRLKVVSDVRSTLDLRLTPCRRSTQRP